MDVKFPEMQIVAMNQSLQKRVKAAMDAKGMNALQTSKKAGLGQSFVRDILRGKTRSPTAENMEKGAVGCEPPDTVALFEHLDSYFHKLPPGSLTLNMEDLAGLHLKPRLPPIYTRHKRPLGEFSIHRFLASLPFDIILPS